MQEQSNIKDLIQTYRREGRITLPKRLRSQFENECAKIGIKLVVLNQDNDYILFSDNDAIFRRIVADKKKHALTRIIIKLESINPKNKALSVKEQQRECYLYIMRMNKMYGIKPNEIISATKYNKKIDLSFMF